MSGTNEGSAPGNPLPADAIYEFARLSAVTVSPDGERVAFLAQEYAADEETSHTSLYVAPTDGSREPHRLTRASDAAEPRWSPDGRKLGFIAAREPDVALSVGPADADDDCDGPTDEAETTDGADTGDEADIADVADTAEEPDLGDDEPKPQVWAFDLDRGGDARQLTTRAEGVRGFDWGPDGERVVVAARDPTGAEREYLRQVRDDGPIEIERLQHCTDGVGYTDPVTSYLFVVDVESRAERRLDDAYGGGAYEPDLGLRPAWSPDGEHVAFLSNRTDRPDDSAALDVYVVDPDGGAADRLTDGSVLPRELAWSPDSTRIAFATLEASNFFRPQEAHVVDVESGRSESLSGHLDRTISTWGNPRWLDAETLLAPVGEEGWTRPVAFDAATGDAERRFDALGRDRTLTALAVGGGRVVCGVGDPAAGEGLYALPELDGSSFDDATVRLAGVTEAFADTHPTPEFHRVRTSHDDADGDDDGPVEVESMVYAPAGFDPEDSAAHPTVLIPHGGPMSYDEPELSFWTAYLTSRGYVVCRPNFRGSTSYGRAFTETLRGRPGTVEILDQLAAVDELVDRGWADPDRLFVAGSSYGGVSAAHLVARTDRFVAAAPDAGFYDARSLFATADNHVHWTNTIGVPWEHPEAYEAASAITDVGDVETPLLVMAGEDDRRSPASQSEQLYVSVRKRGIPAKLLVLQGVAHGAGGPANLLYRFEAMVEWFERFDPAVAED